MKTNVSIKFSSIEEYREIEKKLIELGYKEHKLFGLKTKDCIEVKLNNDKTFTPLLFTFPIIKTYNSLEEFLKDQVMKVNKFNTWRKRLYRCSIYRNNWNNLSIKNKKLNNHEYHYDI